MPNYVCGPVKGRRTGFSTVWKWHRHVCLIAVSACFNRFSVRTENSLSWKIYDINVNINFHIRCQEFNPTELISISLERYIRKNEVCTGVNTEEILPVLSTFTTARLQNCYAVDIGASRACQVFARRKALDVRIYVSDLRELVIRWVDLNDSRSLQMFHTWLTKLDQIASSTLNGL